MAADTTAGANTTAGATAGAAAGADTKYPLHLELPWVEKYRPQKLGDVVGNTETIQALRRIAQDGNVPHLILSGTPGIGKTTAVLCLARELLGGDGRLLKEAVLELNASDDRGIDVVRNMIKTFAQKKVTLPHNRHKVVILDEADSITASAQQALRRTMEIYSNSTRFVFCCNQSSKIIEPLQSRCSILRFNRLRDEDVLLVLKRILHHEHVHTYTDDGLGALIFTCDGDMRQAVNNLQSVYYGFGLVSSDNVFKLVDMPNPLVVRRMLTDALRGHVDAALAVLRDLCGKGYSALDIVNVCFRVCKTIGGDGVDGGRQLEVLRRVGECQMRVVEGVGSYLQLSGMVVGVAGVEGSR